MNTLLASGEKPQDLPEITPLFQGTRENPELRASITNLSADNFTPSILPMVALKVYIPKLTYFNIISASITDNMVPAKIFFQK